VGGNRPSSRAGGTGGAGVVVTAGETLGDGGGGVVAPMSVET
jgi:hypothetical protein